MVKKGIWIGKLLIKEICERILFWSKKFYRRKFGSENSLFQKIFFSKLIFGQKKQQHHKSCIIIQAQLSMIILNHICKTHLLHIQQRIIIKSSHKS